MLSRGEGGVGLGPLQVSGLDQRESASDRDDRSSTVLWEGARTNVSCGKGYGVGAVALEQVRRAADTYIGSLDLPRRLRHQRYEAETYRIGYHQKRNAEPSRCHIRTRIASYLEMGINPDSIKCIDQKPLLHKGK